MMAAGVLAVLVLVAAVFASIAPQAGRSTEHEMLYGAGAGCAGFQDGGTMQAGDARKWQRAAR